MNKLQRLVQPSARTLLARILDQPGLAQQVQTLPPPVLGKLINRIGLEDAGELVALATTEQLARMFDEDLWVNQRPGEEERFDAERFLVWLEIMLEAGESFVADRLAALPEDLVTLAFHRQLVVLNIDDLAVYMQEQSQRDARQLDKALEGLLYEELDEYQIMARHPEGWDTVFAAILALDREHHDLLARILERCCSMTADYVEDHGGLYEVLTSEEMLESDLAADREDRRAEQGHVAPATASSFLTLARRRMHASHVEHDPVTRAYFRDLAPSKAPQRPVPSQYDGLSQLLKEAEVIVESQPTLALPASTQTRKEPLLMRALQRLAEANPDRFAACSEELAYLANVVVAGCSFRQRRLRPIEALRLVMATCNLGLLLALVGESEKINTKRASALLERYPADGLFRLAWSELHQKVVLPAARLASSWLAEQAAQAPVNERGSLTKAEQRLRKATSDGTPWKASSTLELLYEGYDAVLVDALRGLMDECPTLPPPARAARGREDLRFIATIRQLGKAQDLVASGMRHRSGAAAGRAVSTKPSGA